MHPFNGGRASSASSLSLPLSPSLPLPLSLSLPLPLLDMAESSCRELRTSPCQSHLRHKLPPPEDEAEAGAAGATAARRSAAKAGLGCTENSCAEAAAESGDDSISGARHAMTPSSSAAFSPLHSA
ncbi:hypothetical protein TSOC_003176 [Tetrabaena socialis]|uniref:Uncharacterized protein n=1 Tax=Tetrabaena socialis TaxID=47790 RepID=A0A2J8AC62_9CHLO|nr:hypothetical protein TSOC_003176 [Tetrabaena socialis]|eukprot:PNH10114.1 hypothetical protein TSOC_003176 [Tetrabaena socialis]